MAKKRFGGKLKRYRIRAGYENLQKAADALGVDRSYLSKLEAGLSNPSSRFFNEMAALYRLTPEETFDLINLIGFRKEVITVAEQKQGEPQFGPQIAIPQARAEILYSDAVQVDVNEFGVVLNFAQRLGPSNKQIVVSRVGMSKEHVRALIKIIESLLERQKGQEATRKVGFEM